MWAERGDLTNGWSYMNKWTWNIYANHQPEDVKIYFPKDYLRKSWVDFIFGNDCDGLNITVCCWSPILVCIFSHFGRVGSRPFARPSGLKTKYKDHPKISSQVGGRGWVYYLLLSSIFSLHVYNLNTNSFRCLKRQKENWKKCKRKLTLFCSWNFEFLYIFDMWFIN